MRTFTKYARSRLLGTRIIDTIVLLKQIITRQTGDIYNLNACINQSLISY